MLTFGCHIIFYSPLSRIRKLRIIRKVMGARGGGKQPKKTSCKEKGQENIVLRRQTKVMHQQKSLMEI